MSTKKAQRIGIWIIVIVFSIGAIGTFAVLILGTQNDKNLEDRIATLTQEYQTEVAAQTSELSSIYYDEFSPYKERVATFDKADAKELSTKDIKVGDGDKITDASSYSAYYIGWTPDGAIFDSSIEGESLVAPLSVTPGGVIQGWADGVVGMKTGGVRELTIPSDLAYGATGSGDNIGPNTPLRFIVMIIPTPEEVKIPQELIDYYTAQGY